MNKVSMTLAGALIATIAAIAPTTAMASAADKDASTVHITNKSDWEIHHFFMQPSDSEAWGPDQLGDNIIKANGGSFELNKIPCDTYDIKLVDEDGDECVVEAVDVCASKEGWVITSKVLVACTGKGGDDDDDE